MSVSFPDFSDWRKTQHTFVDVAAGREQSYTMTGLGRAERVQARMVSANLLRVLGVQPALGRDFSDAEELPYAPPVALFPTSSGARASAVTPARSAARSRSTAAPLRSSVSAR